MKTIPTLVDIQVAHERIKSYVIETPVLSSDYINELTGCEVFFKCENLQKIGAFKARGGLNAVLSLTEEEQKLGITTHSSGNHAQAIALAAKKVGTKAYIVMPNNAPITKKKGVLALGGEIIECEPTLEAREATLQKVVEKTGAIFIHPFNNYEVITGQATATLELINKIADLQVIMAPVGGGGLLSGTALVAHYLLPTADVIAGEPAGAADAILSFKSGKIEKAPYIKTIADGLMANLGDKTLEIIRLYVKDIITVSEAEIVAAMKLVWENLKIIIEPSSAVPFAALLKQKEKFTGKKTGIILTGGNIDLDKLPF